MLQIYSVCQQAANDCGVASLAMATGLTYEEAVAAFVSCGLGQRRGRRPALSSNFVELRKALNELGFQSRLRRFVAWERVTRPSIVKVDVGHPFNWHWVFATRLEGVVGPVVVDPSHGVPFVPSGVPDQPVRGAALRPLKPKGCFIEIVQLNPGISASS